VGLIVTVQFDIIVFSFVIDLKPIKVGRRLSDSGIGLDTIAVPTYSSGCPGKACRGNLCRGGPPSK
jgi:hypothetical protein